MPGTHGKALIPRATARGTLRNKQEAITPGRNRRGFLVLFRKRKSPRTAPRKGPSRIEAEGTAPSRKNTASVRRPKKNPDTPHLAGKMARYLPETREKARCVPDSGEKARYVPAGRESRNTLQRVLENLRHGPPRSATLRSPQPAPGNSSPNHDRPPTPSKPVGWNIMTGFPHT